MKGFFVCIFMMLAISSYAQPVRPAMQRIHAAKMAYVTDMMQLTEEQSVKFVPLYNEYEKELKDTRLQFVKKYNISPEDDMAARMQIDDDLDYQEQVIELKRKYNDRFLKVISQKQLSDMYMAERAFRKELINRLKDRNGRMRGGR